MKYEITDACLGCGACVEYCSVDAIRAGTPYQIDVNICTGCGKCAGSCPVGAIMSV